MMNMRLSNNNGKYYLHKRANYNSNLYQAINYPIEFDTEYLRE